MKSSRNYEKSSTGSTFFSGGFYIVKCTINQDGTVWHVAAPDVKFYFGFGPKRLCGRQVWLKRNLLCTL